MDKNYTKREVLAAMKKIFSDSKVDFQPEFLDSFTFTDEEAQELIERFPAMESQFRRKETYRGLCQ